MKKKDFKKVIKLIDVKPCELLEQTDEWCEKHCDAEKSMTTSMKCWKHAIKEGW